MKKYIVILTAGITFIACHSSPSHDGTYTARLEGEYAIAEDTLIVEGNYITNRTSYQKTSNGKLLFKGFKKRTWLLNSADAPPVQFRQDKLIIGQTIYTKQP